MEAAEGICVAIRMRPLNDRELTGGQEQIFRCISGYNAIAQTGKDGQLVEGQTYYYDKVFDESSSTTDVFSYVARDIVRGVVQGINGTIFACKFLYELYLLLILIFNFSRRTNIIRKNSYNDWWRQPTWCPRLGR